MKPTPQSHIRYANQKHDDKREDKSVARSRIAKQTAEFEKRKKIDKIPRGMSGDAHKTARQLAEEFRCGKGRG